MLHVSAFSSVPAFEQKIPLMRAQEAKCEVNTIVRSMFNNIGITKLCMCIIHNVFKLRNSTVSVLESFLSLVYC